MLTAFRGGHPLVRSSLTFWTPYCNLGFTITAPCNGLFSPLWRKSNVTTHCLALEAFWNLGASLLDLLLLATSMPAKIVLCEYSQVLLTAQDNSGGSFCVLFAQQVPTAVFSVYALFFLIHLHFLQDGTFVPVQNNASL